MRLAQTPALWPQERAHAIRPTAVGKKNWLFIGAPEAGSEAATFHTLIGSCLRRGLNPRDCLIWLFARLPTATNQNVTDLTLQGDGQDDRQGMAKKAGDVHARNCQSRPAPVNGDATPTTGLGVG